MTLLQLFSLREHLLAVEKQRDAKAAEAAAWASRTQEVQEAADNQLSYQQIEIQVHAQLCPDTRPPPPYPPPLTAWGAGSAPAIARARQ